MSTTIVWAVASGARADCPSPTKPVYKDLPDFASDSGFDLQIRSSPAGSLVRVTGDTVIIDQASLASLLSSPSEPKTKIATLTFDARVLVIRGPISLEGAKLNLLGETIRFERGGTITLVPNPAAPHRELRLIADKVEFIGGGRRPLDMSITANPDVSVQITARSFDGSQAPAAAWRRFVDSVEQDDPPVQVAFVLGDAASHSLDTVWRDEMQWPLYLTAKVRKHFNRAPFDPKNQATIQGVLARYQTAMAGWREPQPIAVLTSVKAALDDGTDLSGHGPAYTPKQDLAAQQKALRAQIDRSTFDLLSELLASTVSDEQSVKDALAATRTELGTVDQQVGALQTEVEAANQKLQVLAQAASGVADRMKQRSEYLKVMTERDFQRMRDAQSVKQCPPQVTDLRLEQAPMSGIAYRSSPGWCEALATMSLRG
ncbi:hypothetical protein [Caulobacter sp. CCH9-E1]|uniref:hypothetical protein n=1 Tax=Caulobacter sp. CCH9-E1 TaxID=1768768 RepID=UPI0012E330D0|nr:hypothetical protein [Caulobacter sp. CCH9-E1]